MLQKTINITLAIFVLAMAGLFIFWLNNRNTPEPTQAPVITEERVETTTETPAPAATTITLSTAELAKHNQPSDCWLLISNKIYEVTTFLNTHPGGSSVIIPFCGKDATNAFTTQDGQGSHSNSAQSMLGDYVLGTLNETIVK